MAVYKDGNFPSGAGTLTVNSVDYKLNSFSGPDSSDTVVNVANESGEHSGAVAFKGPRTATAELQLANANVALPTTAAENSTTGTFNYANVNYFITGVSPVKPSQGVWTVTINAQALA